MSTERIDRKRSGWVNPSKRPTGPNGRPLCRYCDQEIQDRKRRTFCSDDCVAEHRIRTDPGFVREQVFRRDQGVCALCGFDTKEIDREIGRLKHRHWSPERSAILALHGIPETRQTYWDADHIVPVVKGGGACGIENYRTLCVRCHQGETARLAAARALERKTAKEAELGIVRLPLEATE